MVSPLDIVPSYPETDIFCQNFKKNFLPAPYLFPDRTGFHLSEAHPPQTKRRPRLEALQPGAVFRNDMVLYRMV